MKTKILLLLLMLAIPASAFQFTNIFTGTTPGDHTGDSLPVAGGKINTNFYYLTNLVQVVQTNWLVNTLYTNTGIRSLSVAATTVFTNAAVAGENELNLYSGGQAVALTNVCGSGGQTLVTGLATTNFGFVSTFVIPGQVWAFSNVVVGGGNSCGIKSGTGQQVSY